MTWSIKSNRLNVEDLLTEESLYFTGNGYLGVRGNFEEGYTEEAKTIRGTYINAFHDITDITYGEKLYAFPETQQKLLNIIDSQTIKVALVHDGEEEWFSLFGKSGEVISYERALHFDKGYSERHIHWKSPSGKEVKIHFKRLVSFNHLEFFIQEIEVEPVNFNGIVKIFSNVNGDVSNFVDKNDPRVASGHAKRLEVTESKLEGSVAAVEVETYRSKLRAACAASYQLSVEGEINHKEGTQSIETIFTFDLAEKVTFTKTSVFTDTLRHGDHPIQTAIELHAKIGNQTFSHWLENQENYLKDFWKHAGIEIKGDESLQEGLRFNLYHLLQSAGRDRYSNISAKGLSGEGYEGHYFWDTEIYMVPVFLMTKPDLAKQLLLYRYSILDGARNRAKEMGHKQGALFPWRTISGSESSAYFPAGTAQYHISADVAYSYIQYFLATNDLEFLRDFGAEVLIETARLWIDTGHYHDGKFKIDAVTGPDEYTCIVNNNYYTNVMAKHNLKWAAKSLSLLKERYPEQYGGLIKRLNIGGNEESSWEEAAEKMYLPFDESLNINPQDDTFLQKAIWDFEHTPEDHYPLLLNYHPLTLYRYQVCKQADTVLAHFLLEDEQDMSVIKKSFDYYEKITTHDSSLSSCVFSIMAAKVGYYDKAYDYFIETARLDLDNTHGNTKDGLHMANMGGTWMAIVFGFAGLRVKESGIYFNPSIPKQWDSLAFSLQFQGRLLKISIDKNNVNVTIEEGNNLEVMIYEQSYEVSGDKALEVPLRS
ncbi:glycosyl hydrolase family 65 protein [Bacillus sp. 31A1R]|uniref:Glycosyl hydrolase family 65 protein n=1 Tax=Robertmurraya mangrovi TaxID=3098077 RepID=A0ABU5J3K8_9BACI|nr:glycosyl hydrolase family 65 protein [Bacillus sp. 31A1R]MDZ5473988.1 glycosyl hydrolase family 65 protein [Bacillus sp. 31A1R]